jgi:hypothetical protein
MNDMTLMVYGLLMKSSNLTKLVRSGIQDLTITDLWFTCPECKGVQHSDAMVLLGVGVGANGALQQDVAVQSVREFFRLEGEDIRGLSPELINDKSTGAVALRCVECASAMWDFNLDIPNEDAEEGVTVQ